MIILTPTRTCDIKHGQNCEVLVGCSDVIAARHELLALALARAPGEPQLWLDDDVENVTQGDIDELLRVQQISGAAIVSGYYANAKGQPLNRPKYGVYGDDWHEILACGFGCVLVMPEVWRHIGEPTTPTIRTEKGKCPAVFEHFIDWDGWCEGEDYSFCARAIRDGLKIVAATDVSLRHKGTYLPPADIRRGLKKFFTERPPVETLVNCCGNVRPERAQCLASVSASDLPGFSVLDEGAGNITRDWLNMLRRAASSKAALVLMIEDDVVACHDIHERIQNWISGSRYVWRSPYFGAASLCRIGSRGEPRPNYGTQAVLMLPERAAQLLALCEPLLLDAMNMQNAELSRAVHEKTQTVFDNIFWQQLYAADLEAIFPAKSWACHIGAGNSTWWEHPDSAWGTPDFVGTNTEGLAT